MAVLKQLIDASRLPMGLCDAIEMVLHPNPCLAALLGLPAQQGGAGLTSRSVVRRWLAAADVAEDTEFTATAAEGKTASHWSVEVTSLADRRWKVITLLPQTRRVLAEQALAASEEALSSLMDQKQSLLMRCSADGAPVWVNRRLRELAGIDDARDVTWPELLDAASLDALHEALEAHLHERTGFVLHLPVQADGGTIHRLRFSPLFDTGGAVSAWSVSGVDIDQWHSAWCAGHPMGAPLAQLEDFVWHMTPDAKRLSPVDPRERHPLAADLDGQPVTWAEWCAHIRADDRALALGIPARVRDGETVQLVLSLQNPLDEHKAVAIEAFPVGLDDDGVKAIGGVFRPMLNTEKQQAYWVRCEASDNASFERQRQLLARDQMRLLLFDNEATFIAVAGTLPAAVTVFEAPSDPLRLISVVEALHAEGITMPWLVVGTRNYPLEMIVRLMRLGASDVLSAAAGPRLVAETLRTALSRLDRVAHPLRPSAANSALQSQLDALSRREKEVLKGLMDGGTNKVIAQQLNLSPRTVESHRAHLMDRMGAKSLADLLRRVAEAGWKG